MSVFPTNFENRRGRPTVLAVGEARGYFNVSSFFLPLFDRRLEIFSQRVVKQPTNQSFVENRNYRYFDYKCRNFYFYMK